MGSPAGGDNAELREIHQKMSRKIAQLTKVIYTLNTKNEDSDAKLKFLTQKHQEELENLSQVEKPSNENNVELNQLKSDKNSLKNLGGV